MPFSIFTILYTLAGKRTSMGNKEILQEMYLSLAGEPPQQMTALPGAGSNRRYYRLEGKRRMVGVRGTSAEENRAFVYMARHFRSAGLPVPEVYAVSDDGLCYLQEDLGDTLLFDAIRPGRESGQFSPE